MTPPFGEHPQDAHDHAQSEDTQNHEHQWTTPLRAKKEMQSDVAWVVQRKGKQRKEDSRFERPLQESKDLFQVTRSNFNGFILNGE